MLTRLKHIKTAKKTHKDGKTVTHYYHRKTGKRIEGKPGTQEFLESYTLASKFDHDKSDGTVSALITDFKESQIFLEFSTRTKKDYQKHFDIIGSKWGPMPIEVLDDVRIRKDLLQWRDTLAKRSLRQADYVWATFRRIVQFGIDNSSISHNYLSKPRRLYKSNRRDKIWLPEHVSAFMDVANPQMQTAMILALHTGQRKSDLVKLTWNAYDGKGISLTQSKTKKDVFIPVTITLKKILDNLPRTAITILTTTKGAPWKIEGFDTAWQRTTKKANIKDRTFHDLRGTAITILDEQECTEAQIAAITGHSRKYISQILDDYSSRTKKIAYAAIARLEKSWINDVGK